MAKSQAILVVGEITGNQLSTTTAELLAAGRQLAQQAQSSVAVGLLGTDLASVAREALQAGADRVYTVEAARLDAPGIELRLQAWEEICRTAQPNILLLGRTPLGRELAPRLACRLGVSLVQDCLQVDIDSDTDCLIGTRPVYGGNIHARVRSTSAPQVAALRAKAYAPLEPDPDRQGEVLSVPVAFDDSVVQVTVLREEIDRSLGIKLEDARIVVSGGRGLGGPEPFKELQELAGVLEAGIGASRAAVDAGWVPGNWQIGLTGKTITPELYITVGISGASQHMAGCSSARVIVAINTDREANIFRAARYGVVGDWQTVLPAFMEAVRHLP